MYKVLLAVLLLIPSAFAQTLPTDVPTYLQDISVTIHATSVNGSESQGSGVIYTRNGRNYVWTAAHVVAGLRQVRDVIDPKTGSSKTIVEFRDADIVKELNENGRRVGQLEMAAEVIRYSNADTGEDLALLRIRKKDFVRTSAVFYTETSIPAIGTDLLHCGSLKGQFGANSMTTGIMSQIGRVIQGQVYDQTTCAAFPGSSGGGIFLKDGRYIGMLTRGAGETFNLIVPIRRLQAWAKRAEVEFAINESIPVPSDEELQKKPVEDGGSNVELQSRAMTREYPFMIVRTPATQPAK